MWLRSPGAIAAALLPALGMGALVALMTLSIGWQPLALVVEGSGGWPRAWATSSTPTRRPTRCWRWTASPPSARSASSASPRSSLIPDDFDARIAGGTGAELELYLNKSSTSISPTTSAAALTRSVAELDAPQLGLLGELHGPSTGVLLPNPYRVAVAEHDLRETNVTRSSSIK